MVHGARQPPRAEALVSLLTTQPADGTDAKPGQLRHRERRTRWETPLCYGQSFNRRPESQRPGLRRGCVCIKVRRGDEGSPHPIWRVSLEEEVRGQKRAPRDGRGSTQGEDSCLQAQQGGPRGTLTLDVSPPEWLDTNFGSSPQPQRFEGAARADGGSRGEVRTRPRAGSPGAPRGHGGLSSRSGL